MSVMSVAEALLAGIREGKETENLDLLYAADAVSVEAMDMGQGRETHGVAGIKAKHEWWNGAFEVMEANASGPFPDGDKRFAVIFEVKAKHRETGEISDMREVGLYTVENGKITKEEFFYAE